MNVTIYGSGYVGLVTGACLANVGHHVLCVDIDVEKIQQLQQGIVPIFEPNLEKMIQVSLADKTIDFTTDLDKAVSHSNIQFIAVGTPPNEDGSADLAHVLAVARQIADRMDSPQLIVNKSTVPVGTADLVNQKVNEILQKRGLDLGFDVASNPEFLKEGSAIADFMKPDRIIIGTDSAEVKSVMHELYAPFNRNHDRMQFMNVRSAELCKYAANNMLATKISFMNEIANISELVGADIEQIRQGIGSDPRIGFHFIYAGCGYGGSCFPKDIKALNRTAETLKYDSAILKAVEKVNSKQKKKLYRLITQHFGDSLEGMKFALWGLAFKPRTDDMREAPSRVLMELLWEAGAAIQAYDPQAMEETRKLYPDQKALNLCGTRDETLVEADALIICTDWQSFKVPDFELLKSTLKEPVIFDGRNLYDPESMRNHGFTYYGIGRGESVRKYY